MTIRVVRKRKWSFFSVQVYLLPNRFSEGKEKGERGQTWHFLYPIMVYFHWEWEFGNTGDVKAGSFAFYIKQREGRPTNIYGK